MKRIITAVAFAVLAVPAFAFAADSSAPYDQNVIDRALPDIRSSVVAEEPSASAGATGAAATSAGSSGWATGPWANDYHFIAPAM